MASEDGGSVTRWITAVKRGDEEAVQSLWDRYFDRLAKLARAKLGISRQGGVEDEEDAVVDAFDSFCRGAVNGRFPRLTDRVDLWKLLGLITVRKALDQRTRRKAARRGGGLPGRGWSPRGAGAHGSGDDLDQILDREPPPDLAAMLAEEYRQRLAALEDEQLRRIAIWRMEGYTEDEIAQRLGCTRRTVARRLELIRLRWLEADS
jgi:DNA-directed RNA polymerase specialized sigma24 family protein